MANLRAAVITDIHFGFDIKDKLGSKAPKLLKMFAKAVNAWAPAFVVEMGDRVSAKDKQTDRDNMIALKSHFSAVAPPAHHLIGNHDIKNLTRAENEEITGSPSSSWSKDEGGFHLIFWNPQFTFTREEGISLQQPDIDWLKNDLDAAKGKPVILFSHVPLDNQNGEEREPISRNYFWTQGEDVRKILEAHGNVKLCMSGHRHRNHHSEINGIHYITQQAFTSMWKEHYRIPSRTFSFVEAKEDGSLTVTLKGKYKTVYEISPAAAPAVA